MNGAENAVTEIRLIDPGRDANVPGAKLCHEWVMGEILASTIEVIADTLGQPIQKLHLPGLRIDP